MDEYGMNEFELIKKADVMRIINAENAVVLNNRKERSTDEVLCAIASQINGLQTMAKSGSRLIDANAEVKRLKNDYCEECTKKGNYGIFGVACTPCWVKDAVEEFENAPTIEPEVRHGRWTDNGEDKYICSACKGYVYRWFGKSDFCPRCGARMDGGKGGADNG